MEGHCVGQLTDASVVLRFGYQAIRRAGLPTEEILTKAGVALNQVDTNARTPLSAQYAFWTAAQEVSKDPDIGLHLGEHLPLYRGQVIEHLFISSETFGEGLKRALAYQRLISDAFDAKLVVEDGRCYLTNGEQVGADNLVNRHFQNVRFQVCSDSSNLLPKASFIRSSLILISVKVLLKMNTSASMAVR